MFGGFASGIAALAACIPLMFVLTFIGVDDDVIFRTVRALCIIAAVMPLTTSLLSTLHSGWKKSVFRRRRPDLASMV